MGKTKKKPHYVGASKAYTNPFALQAAARSNIGSSFIPIIFQNPYNDNDYDIIEDAHLNTFAGKVLDEKVNAVMAGGIKPTFELREPFDDKGAKLDEDTVNEILNKFEKAKAELIKIDERKSIDFNQKAKDSIRNMLVFGRSVLAFEPDGKEIPQALKPLHPRDIGRVFVHQIDWSLSSVHAFQRGEVIHDDEMVYFVNMQNSPARRGMWYGFSEMQRVIGVARALRKIKEFDAPEVAESLWAGYGIVRVDNEGLSESEKKKDLQTIRDNMKPGSFTFINGKKDEIEFMNMDTDPRLTELMDLADKYERDIIGNSGLPGPLFGREEESNMATLFGKIRLSYKGPVRSVREDVSKIIGEQWYEHNLRLIDSDAAAVVRVKAEFEPIIIESWRDNIDSLLKLKELIPNIPDQEILKLADLEELRDKLETDTEPDPLGLQKLKDTNNRIRDENQKQELIDLTRKNNRK